MCLKKKVVTENKYLSMDQTAKYQFAEESRRKRNLSSASISRA